MIQRDGSLGASLQTGVHRVTSNWQDRRRRAKASSGVRVSVIIPVYNALPYVIDLLTSLDRQGLNARQLQVIIVDDGSTDGGDAVLEDYARSHTHATVIHQANSGWPGQPRNLGLDIATGRWVFFADADDWFAPDALLELADFGDRHDAQVVLPRVKRCGTRHGGKFRETLVSASKRQAFRTFTPHKLIRRDLIEEPGMRFREGKVRLEDGIFLSRCYLLADRIGILAERDLYYFRGREDGKNLSAERIDPDAYIPSLEAIAQNVYELSRSQKMARILITELVRRKCFHIYTPERFARAPVDLQLKWMTAHAGFFARHVTPEVRSALSEVNARRCDLILAHDRLALLDHIARPGTTDEVIDAATANGRVEPTSAR
ncbi:glycosyltransferase family 2 protein [Microlunatus soli]|uniref:Glycosyltransferase involved in cell wall bisynthesis n=1 Tax=Microlunatus soli TaxID=630515 RepID=A0A1H1M9T9_9ACTN|nr:glycosyltransferase family 2 protein [Microlunatus soli]SDR83322.1 Glycosyltransferase involved in cell wall bisynthesis [Microlunatus soli]